MLTRRIQQLFARIPEILFGFTDISYSPYAEQYKSALVFAVPYEEQLTLARYTEEGFENSILNARGKAENILEQIKRLLEEEKAAYFIPPAAQQNEEELQAVFSFKYAAVNAGLGWIGKNDVLITERYGPRVRLSAVLIDAEVEYGMKSVESKCPAGCTKCIDICPHKALTGKTWSIHARRSDLIDYHLCSRKRSEYIKSHGRKHSCGLCMVVCPFGRYEEKDVSDEPSGVEVCTAKAVERTGVQR